MPPTAEELLRFWFPPGRPSLQDIVRRMDWWFRAGADAEVKHRFTPLLEAAIRGDLDAWSGAPRSRLALIIVLDQFSRAVYRGTERAFAQDPKARALTREGLAAGHYAALATPWEKMFYLLPLAHSELGLEDQELAVSLAEAQIEEGPAEYRPLLEFSALQARGHRDVIARFGRHPHRNEVLSRASTPGEIDYLARGAFVHNRPLPADLARLLER
jgi:uncharacterized protein (DUF924 family)